MGAGAIHHICGIGLSFCEHTGLALFPDRFPGGNLLFCYIAIFINAKINNSRRE